MKRTAVIMAGGSGERFWPLSRKRKPKQLLRLASEDKMMIEESIERISPLIPPEDVFIITGELLLDPMRKALEMLPPENIVAEPAKRNTAPCLGLAASFIAERYSEGYKPEDISIAVLTADQSIPDTEGFLKTVKAALDHVEKNPVLATIGIPPERPETGYGYIEVDESFDPDKEEVEIKPVVRFTEKPDVDTAEKFMKAGNYLWNSGMFFWRMDTFIDSMKKCLPEVGEQLGEMSRRYFKKTRLQLPEALETVRPIFEEFPNTSIDYGLMEKADNVVVCRAKFSWDDIGSWDSLPRIRPVDSSGNVKSGNTVTFDMNDSVIINESSDDEMIVSAFGMDDVVIVVTDDAVLVCPKDSVQEVKKSVETIKKDFGDKWL